MRVASRMPIVPARSATATSTVMRRLAARSAPMNDSSRSSRSASGESDLRGVPDLGADRGLRITHGAAAEQDHVCQLRTAGDGIADERAGAEGGDQALAARADRRRAH